MIFPNKYLRLIIWSRQTSIGLGALNKKNDISIFRAYANVRKSEPVKFSTSNAKKWDSMDTFYSEKARNTPFSQPLFVIGSFATLFIYFAFLREENELDEIFERPLENTVPNIKEMTIRHQILQYEQLKLDTTSLKEALNKEIEARKIRESENKVK